MTVPCPNIFKGNKVPSPWSFVTTPQGAVSQELEWQTYCMRSNHIRDVHFGMVVCNINLSNSWLLPRYSLFAENKRSSIWQHCCHWWHCTFSLHISDHMKDKQRFLTPGHQGWNDLHSLCRIGMEYYLLNNDDNNIIYWIMMIIMIMMMMIIIMMTMMIIGTATIMIMIIIITTTLTMTIMKMIMIKTAQTPCQSLYKDRRI